MPSAGNFKSAADLDKAIEYAVGVSQEKLSDQVQQRFDAQADRIDKLSETVLGSQKATQPMLRL